jgi:hypothetical protein
MHTRLWSKSSLSEDWRRWNDNIKIDLKEIRCEDVEWIHLVLDWGKWQSLVNTVMSLQVA